MNSKKITLVSFRNFEKAFLKEISKTVQQEFGGDVFIKESYIDLSECYDAGRRQYNGNKILKEINSMIIPGHKSIGLFNVDLFIPILTFIFGQAQLGGLTAIASIYRLKNECYGMAKDEELQMNRFKKVIIHELGHTYGLTHCHLPSCVMRSGTYVEDLDQKKQHFCTSCLQKLEDG